MKSVENNENKMSKAQGHIQTNSIPLGVSGKWKTRDAPFHGSKLNTVKIHATNCCLRLHVVLVPNKFLPEQLDTCVCVYWTHAMFRVYCTRCERICFVQQTTRQRCVRKRFLKYSCMNRYVYSRYSTILPRFHSGNLDARVRRVMAL